MSAEGFPSKYGHVNVQTTGNRPPQFTPLMMFCKAELKALTASEQMQMLIYLLFTQRAGMTMVDPRGANSVMMTASRHFTRALATVWRAESAAARF